MNGKLSIVATPIGNLEDITLRAIRTLKEADVVLCEDTRVTGKLLKHLEIESKMIRCDAEKEEKCAELTLELIKKDKHVAFVSDAGTPCISDPGSRLVHSIRQSLPDCIIETVPGATAITASIAIAGINEPNFTFLGFVPHKKGRETFFKKVAEMKGLVVFYESPHRIIKTLSSLTEFLDEKKKVSVARELTKMHEEFVSGTPKEMLEYFELNKEHVRGEFVILVSKKLEPRLPQACG